MTTAPTSLPATRPRALAALLAVFCLGLSLIMVVGAVLPPLYPAIGREFGLGGTQLGSISLALWLPYALCQVPAGILGDRFGLRRCLVAALALATIALVLVGVASPSYGSLLLLVAVFGVSLSSYYPATNGLTLTLVPASWRGVSVAVVFAGVPAGLIGGLVLPSTLATADENWRGTFLLLAALMALLLLALLLIVPPVSAPVVRFEQVIATLRHPDLLAVNVVNFCASYGFWTAVNWGPSFLLRERGLPLATAGQYVALMAAVSLPAAFFFGRLSDRIGRRWLAVWLSVGGGVALLAFAFVQSATGLLAVSVAYGLLGMLALNPVIIAWGGDQARQTEGVMVGAAMGAMNLFRMLPASLAPVAAGWLLDRTGSLVPGFGLAAGVVLTGALFSLRAREVGRR